VTLMAPFKEKLLENALVELTLLLLCVTNVSQVLWVKIVNIACLVTFLIVQMVVANHVVVIPLAPTLLTIVIQLMVNVSARKGLKGYNVIIVLEVKLEINVTNAQMTIPEKVLLEIAFQVAVPNLAHGKELTMELVFVKKNLLVGNVMHAVLDIQEIFVTVVTRATFKIQMIQIIHMNVKVRFC